MDDFAIGVGPVEQRNIRREEIGDLANFIDLLTVAFQEFQKPGRWAAARDTASIIVPVAGFAGTSLGARQQGQEGQCEEDQRPQILSAGK